MKVEWESREKIEVIKWKLREKVQRKIEWWSGERKWREYRENGVKIERESEKMREKIEWGSKGESGWESIMRKW